MTKQEAYERIRAHFLADQRFGYDSLREKCQYLTDDGAKCAVGCLIPGDSPMAFSTVTVGALIDEYPDEWQKVFGMYDPDEGNFISFLQAAQDVHDSEATDADGTIENFIDNLDDLADKYGLQVVSA